MCVGVCGCARARACWCVRACMTVTRRMTCIISPNHSYYLSIARHQWHHLEVLTSESVVTSGYLHFFFSFRPCATQHSVAYNKLLTVDKLIVFISANTVFSSTMASGTVASYHWLLSHPWLVKKMNVSEPLSVQVNTSTGRKERKQFSAQTWLWPLPTALHMQAILAYAK